jgi:hypothetical protein
MASLYVSSPLKTESIGTATNLIKHHDQEFRISRYYRLLRASSDKKSSDLQRFVAAWSAIEIFINSTFKSHYEKRWFNIMEEGAPASATQVFERLKTVMADKYRLTDKFLVIASILNPEMATEDEKEFREAKKRRDDFFHGVEMPVEHLPTRVIQRILRKLIKLHLKAMPFG